MGYPERSYYDILGIPRNAGADQIKAAYQKRREACQAEPFPGQSEAAREALLDLDEAHDVLLDPVRRDAYDAWLRMKDYQRAQAKHRAEESARQTCRWEVVAVPPGASQEAKRAMPEESSAVPSVPEAQVQEIRHQTEEPCSGCPAPVGAGRRWAWVAGVLAVCLVGAAAAGIMVSSQKQARLEELEQRIEALEGDAAAFAAGVYDYLKDSTTAGAAALCTQAREFMQAAAPSDDSGPAPAAESAGSSGIDWDAAREKAREQDAKQYEEMVKSSQARKK